jgi:hypothetical protein
MQKISRPPILDSTPAKAWGQSQGFSILHRLFVCCHAYFFDRARKLAWIYGYRFAQRLRDHKIPLSDWQLSERPFDSFLASCRRPRKLFVSSHLIPLTPSNTEAGQYMADHCHSFT